MRKWLKIEIRNTQKFINQLVQYSVHWKHFLLFNSNTCQKFSNRYSSFDMLAACGSIKNISVNSNCFDELKKFNKETEDWIFGHLSYDLKNDTEKLVSENSDSILFPELFFFIPRYIIRLKNHELEIGYNENQISEVIRLANEYSFRKLYQANLLLKLAKNR